MAADGKGENAVAHEECPQEWKWNDFFWITLISIASFALRFLFAWRQTGGNLDELLYPDEKYYYLDGASLFLEQGVSYFLTQRSLWNAPVNILWVALWGKQVALIKVVNLLLLALMGFLVWLKAYKLAGNGVAAYVALCLCSCSPPFLSFGPTILTEPLYCVLLVLSFYAFPCTQAGGHLRVCIAGLVLGLATLTRPTTQLYPCFLLLLALPLVLTSRSGLRSLGRQLALFALSALLLIVPWCMKNALCLDKIGIANGAGAVLYLGNDLRSDGDEPAFSGMTYDTFEITKPLGHLHTKSDRRLREVALLRMRQNPRATLKLALRKPFRFLFGNVDHYFYPFRDVFQVFRHMSLQEALRRSLGVVVNSVLAIAGLLGCILVRSAPARVFLVSLWLYFVAVHTVLFPIPRMALPLHALMSIGVGVFVVEVLRGRRFLLGAACVLAVLVVCVTLFWGSAGTLREETRSDKIDSYDIRSELDLDCLEGHHTTRMYPASGQEDAVSFTLVGPDSYVVFEIPERRFRKNAAFFADIKIDAEAQHPWKRELLCGQVFWSLSEEFSENQKRRFEMRADGAFHTYRIVLPAVHTAPVRFLGLGFPGSVEPVRVSLRSVAIAE